MTGLNDSTFCDRAYFDPLEKINATFSFSISDKRRIPNLTTGTVNI